MAAVWPNFPEGIRFNFKVNREVRSNGKEIAQGDGYVYRTTFGLHPFDETIRGTLFLASQDVEVVRSFLETRAADGVPFLWVPIWRLLDYTTTDFDSLPSVDGPLDFGTTWTVEEWPITRAGRIRSTIDLALARQWSHVTEE